MLTLHELKKIVDAPRLGERVPSAKHLMEREKAVAWRRLGKDAEIRAYQSGYALYRVHRAVTVFPIHACGNYCGYQHGTEDTAWVESEQFGKEAWYLRLVLEGEDRIRHNQEVKERRKAISYSIISEDWQAMTTGSDPVLERVVMEETVDGCLALLTRKQRLAVHKYYWEQETQEEIARELGINKAAVSQRLSRAVQRMRDATINMKQNRDSSALKHILK